MSPLLPPQRRTESRPPARASAAHLLDRALEVSARLVWRVRNPAARERWIESAPPAPAVRLPYTALDGWRGSVLFVPPAAGGTGEPVVIAHALGLAPDAYRYGARDTLVSRLSAAGFAVYLTTWRGDTECLAPTARTGVSFDDIVERDVPAALEVVRAHAGYRRAFVVGHGFGGQVAVSHAGRVGGEGLAGVVAMCAPVRFEGPDSAVLRLARVLSHVPGAWRLPAERFGPALAPWIEGRDRVRGVLWHEADGVRVELLRQIALWCDHGSIVDRSGLFDYVAATAAADIPLLVAYALGDELCSEDAALALVAYWGGEVGSLPLPDGFGHLDAVFGPGADVGAYSPIARWLTARRRRCWG